MSTPDFADYKPPGMDPCRWGHNTFLPCPPLGCRCFKEHNPDHWQKLHEQWKQARREEELRLNEPADWMTFLTECCGLYIPGKRED